MYFCLLLLSTPKHYKEDSREMGGAVGQGRLYHHHIMDSGKSIINEIQWNPRNLHFSCTEFLLVLYWKYYSNNSFIDKYHLVIWWNLSIHSFMPFYRCFYWIQEKKKLFWKRSQLNLHFLEKREFCFLFTENPLQSIEPGLFFWFAYLSPPRFWLRLSS